MSEHTKTPWLLSSSFLICSDEARIIANCIPAHDVPVLAIPSLEARANAAFIVRAVNSHEALVAALGALAKWFDCAESRAEVRAREAVSHPDEPLTEATIESRLWFRAVAALKLAGAA